MDGGYVVTDSGDKVLPGSRRPDGTIRKERRIRAGYVPQDEQPVYQSTGVLVGVAARGPDEAVISGLSKRSVTLLLCVAQHQLAVPHSQLASH